MTREELFNTLCDNGLPPEIIKDVLDQKEGLYPKARKRAMKVKFDTMSVSEANKFIKLDEYARTPDTPDWVCRLCTRLGNEFEKLTDLGASIERMSFCVELLLTVFEHLDLEVPLET